MPRSHAQILADLGRAFPRGRPDDQGFALYLQHLSDIPAEVLQVTVDTLIRTGRYFPTISEIREAAAERVLELPAESEALAQIADRIAWGRASQAERSAEPPHVHPLVREALGLVGGFFAFKTTENAGITRSQFLRVYKDLRDGAVTSAQLGRELAAGPQRRELPK